MTAGSRSRMSPRGGDRPHPDIGYGAIVQRVEVAAGQTATMTIRLSERAIALDEIVVTGTAGATERKQLGNTVASIDASRIVETAPLASVDQLIQGRTAGVNMITTQGNVGSAGQIKIRGTKSASLSSDPIMYIDGVRVNSSDDRSGGATAPTRRSSSAANRSIEWRT